MAMLAGGADYRLHDEKRDLEMKAISGVGRQLKVDFISHRRYEDATTGGTFALIDGDFCR